MKGIDVVYVYDGSFQGIRLAGKGVAAALLASEGIPVYSEEELSPALLQKLFNA